MANCSNASNTTLLLVISMNTGVYRSLLSITIKPGTLINLIPIDEPSHDSNLDMKRLLFLLFTAFATVVNAQDSLMIEANGIVIDSHLKSPVKEPIIRVMMNDGSRILHIGDTLGKFTFKEKIVGFDDEIFIVYSSSYPNNFPKTIRYELDSNQTTLLLTDTIELDPMIVCVDTWMLPDIRFKKNSIEYYPYYFPENNQDSLPIDTILTEWVRYFKDNPPDTSLCIEILAFADYSENDRISLKRLDYIYNYLIESGIPESKLIPINMNKKDREMYLYRDGCYPYYFYDNQPVIINIEKIKGAKNKNQEHYYRKNRMVVTFNWKLKETSEPCPKNSSRE